ncbi:DUF4430 domain-containing protein [Neorhodopirellula pilleata]|uniref:Transcobalamin-like C-terminal domain-containing protein n=1 Tax=Neorhodopirellula pilleata TaxID=2714738 RepID=A0A5C6A1C0_9BACT|nr:DUF4430 domain-containing protein [Neorhodopirellula pilleata]TWT93624.1 hypothetical protein Pla100_41420 [Neorhodopirellula pilleata]
MHRFPPFPILRISCIAVLATLVVCGSGCQRSQTIENPSVDVAEDVGTVTIEIILNSDEPTENIRQIVPVHDGESLESVMRGMASQPDEPLEMVISGEGVTAFVQSIHSVTTDANRGWTYTIDGEFATKGIGSVTVESGQTIQWRFTTFEEAMKIQE